MNAPTENNSVDRAARGIKYAVLRKKGRILVLVNPCDKDLRRRSKRRWQLVAGADFQSEALHLFEKTFDLVVSEVVQQPAKGKKEKKRKNQHEAAAVAV
jgi:hypothetical protein